MAKALCYNFSIFSYLRDTVLSDNKKLVKLGLGVIAIAGLGYIIYRMVKNPPKS